MDNDVKAVPKDEITLFGIPASPGVAHGQVFRFLHEEVEVLNYEVKEEDHPKEIARFKEALNLLASRFKRSGKVLPRIWERKRLESLMLI